MIFAPDIPNGYVINGLSNNNSWSTRIQCVLVNGNDPTQTAYLSQECRWENVPFMAENSQSSLDIIKTQSPCRFLTYAQNGLFHQFPESDVPMLYPALPTVDLGGCFIIEPSSHPDKKAKAYCQDAAIESISVTELLAGLNDRNIPAGHVYVRIRLNDGLTLYFPAGYLNFANRGIEPAEYVQSISGDVLFPIESTLASGYIACAMTTDGRVKIEFVTKAYSEVYRNAAQAPMFLGVMNFVIDVDGDVLFYRYL